jgi:TPR repeat protein
MAAAVIVAELEPCADVAFQRLREAADDGDGLACYKLAAVYHKGLYGLQRWE